MEELVDLILELNRNFQEEIPNLNSGGCGIFTRDMYKQLVKLGYKPNIVVIDYSESVFVKKQTLNRVMNKERVRRSDKENTSFAHCCLEINGLLFNGLKIGADLKDRWSRYSFGGKYTIEELELALKVGGWNPSYNRRKRNPTVRKIIKQTVNKIYN